MGDFSFSSDYILNEEYSTDMIVIKITMEKYALVPVLFVYTSHTEFKHLTTRNSTLASMGFLKIGLVRFVVIWIKNLLFAVNKYK